jgi:hypothetical protein
VEEIIYYFLCRLNFRVRKLLNNDNNMNYLKLGIALFILIGLLSCSRITNKVEQKVNEKIDKTIDESLQKVDSAFSKANLDSLKKAVDKMDSISKKMDRKLKDNN